MTVCQRSIKSLWVLKIISIAQTQRNCIRIQTEMNFSQKNKKNGDIISMNLKNKPAQKYNGFEQGPIRPPSEANKIGRASCRERV